MGQLLALPPIATEDVVRAPKTSITMSPTQSDSSEGIEPPLILEHSIAPTAAIPGVGPELTNHARYGTTL